MLSSGDSPPRFSVVLTCDSSVELGQSLVSSLDGQTLGADRFEVVVVTARPSEGTAAVLAAWEARREGRVRVVAAPEGAGALDGLGLEQARGEWVTFAGAADSMDADYLAEVDRFLAAHPETVVCMAHPLVEDENGSVTDTHPLRRHFVGGARVRDLALDPGHFVASAPALFLARTPVLPRTPGATLDPRVPAAFRVAHLAAHRLLASPRALVGIVPAASYRLRRSSNQRPVGVTAEGPETDASSYLDVLEHGYLDLVRTAAAAGPVPSWLQNLVVYELSWILGVQDGGRPPADPDGRWAAFDSLLAEVLGHLDAAVVEATPVARAKRLWRQIMQHSYRADPWHEEVATLARYDADQDLVQVVYRYTHDAPEELVVCDGAVVAPAYAKVRDHHLLGRTVMHERILWVPARGPVRLFLDGRETPLVVGSPQRVTHTVSPGAVRRRLDRSGVRDLPTVTDEPPARPGLVARLARSRLVRSRYADAWLLMDRVHDAGDNGQRLFEYLRRERPEVNAWFTVQRGTPAWRELRRGFRRRVVAHGSLRWKLIALNAEHLLSSHADGPVVEPPQLDGLGVRPRWRFTFLQHGVIKDDLSTWLNPKPIDLFVTSTREEQASVAGDHTRYVFTDREVVLTGLPRFDRLREVAARVGPEDRDLVLVAPTWRNWLSGEVEAGSQRRALAPDLLASEFLRTWLDTVRSPALKAAAEQHGAVVGFLPHPIIQPVLDAVELPDWVRPLTFEDGDVQELFARAAVLLTDYSSMAFNAAYLDRPVVYFQFDRDRVLGGEHVGSRGYFDYDRDGYGPVVTDLDGAVEAVTAALAARAPAAEYQRRIDAAFPERDGRCCERVTEAVLASTRRYEVRSEPSAPS